MVAHDIHDAIAQVREIHEKVVGSGRFRGYSGRVRALGGTLALGGAGIMSLGVYPRTSAGHLIGWGAVLALGLLLNYGALAWWLLSGPRARRDLRHLLPTIDPLPPLYVGGLLTAVLVSSGDYNRLFGIWMLLYGLTNLSSRQVLPKVIWPVGLFYLACGTACLLLPSVSFLNPWPMGVVFFIGEWAGGFVLFLARNPEATFGDFFLPGRRAA